MNSYRWGAAAAEVCARLNLIQATHGVSWVELVLDEMQAEETGAVIDAGGEEAVTGTGVDWCPCGRLAESVGDELSGLGLYQG